MSLSKFGGEGVDVLTPPLPGMAKGVVNHLLETQGHLETSESPGLLTRECTVLGKPC